MLNTRELEKRWFKYKIKSYIPYIVIVTSLVIISVVSLFFFNQTNITKEKKLHTIVKKSSIPLPKIDQNKSIVKKVSPKKMIETPTNIKTSIPVKPLQKSNKLILEPSMEFIKHIQSEDQQPYYQTLHTSTHKRKVEHKKRQTIQQKNVVKEEYMDIQEKQTPQKQQITIKKETAPQKSVITIERRDSQKDIKEIITRFEKSNNPALSLFVAKKSYEIGDYEQAYNYALITNGINHDIEESWLIFAKALVKLHKKSMAIKTLREYIKYSHSGNAKILLNDIKSGNFQ